MVGTASRRNPARLSAPFLRDDWGDEDGCVGELRGLRRCHRRQMQTIAGKSSLAGTASPVCPARRSASDVLTPTCDAHAQGTLRTPADALSDLAPVFLGANLRWTPADRASWDF